jgi:hypothetical protein
MSLLELNVNFDRLAQALERIAEGVEKLVEQGQGEAVMEPQEAQGEALGVWGIGRYRKAQEKAVEVNLEPNALGVWGPARRRGYKDE